MSYLVECISCKICGSDRQRFLGIRGNLEYAGASRLSLGREHMVTNVVQCRVCGFVYTNPTILCREPGGYSDPDKYKSSADNVGPEELFGPAMDLIEKYAVTGKTLLDIGCGKGEFLNVAKKRGWDVCGVEPSGNLADYASKRYDLNIKNAPLQNAQFSDSFFDAAVLNMVLEHIDEPRQFLFEVSRILKDGGVLFIEVPNMDSLALKLATLYFRMNKKRWSAHLSPLHHPFHRYGYNPLSLKRLLGCCGFKIKKVIVRDAVSRGVRNSASVNILERWLCRTAIGISGMLGMGDVLTVAAMKEKGEIC